VDALDGTHLVVGREVPQRTLAARAHPDVHVLVGGDIHGSISGCAGDSDCDYDSGFEARTLRMRPPVCTPRTRRRM